MSFHRYQPCPEQTNSIPLWRLAAHTGVCLGMFGNLRGFVGFLASDKEGNN